MYDIAYWILFRILPRNVATIPGSHISFYVSFTRLELWKWEFKRVVVQKEELNRIK
jgi:hypothetical protein